MNFVFGCFAKRWCCSPMSCSKGGNLSGGRARWGNCLSSSQRSLWLVLRLEEGLRLGRVDENRDAEIAALLPDRVEPRVVDRDALAPTRR